MEVLESPAAEISEVQQLVAQDPAVSARLLRAANSALLGGAMAVEDASQAVVRLGLRETANVAMTAACRSLFDLADRAERSVFPEVWRGLWSEALVGAHGASLIARELRRGDPGRVFIGALFRNVGSLVALKIVASAVVGGHLRPAPAPAALACTMLSRGPELGMRYLRDSKLPDYVVEIAGSLQDLPSPASQPELALIQAAHGLCRELGIAPFPPEELPQEARLAMQALAMDSDRQDYFRLQLQGLSEQVDELL